MKFGRYKQTCRKSIYMHHLLGEINLHITIARTLNHRLLRKLLTNLHRMDKDKFSKLALLYKTKESDLQRAFARWLCRSKFHA